jgi:hypothetical protein
MKKLVPFNFIPQKAFFSATETQCKKYILNWRMNGSNSPKFSISLAMDKDGFDALGHILKC